MCPGFCGVAFLDIRPRVVGSVRTLSGRAPWSEWMIAPDCGARLAMAMPSALVTRAAVWVESIDQPTTRGEYTSRTTAQYTLPSRVRCSVMSLTHKRFGCV